LSAYIYVRVLSASQAESGAGESAQIDLMRHHLKMIGVEDEPTVFRDLAVCRETSPERRPGFSDLMGILKPGDIVAVLRWDRLGTIRSGVPQLLDRLTKMGVRLVTSQGEDTNTAHGRMVINMMLSVAEYELETLRERTKNGLQAMKRKGEAYCRRRYGYSATEDGRFVENAEEMRIVERIQLAAELGYSLSAIASSLNEDGIPAPLGGVWRHTTVRKIVQRISERQAAA